MIESSDLLLLAPERTSLLRTLSAPSRLFPDLTPAMLLVLVTRKVCSNVPILWKVFFDNVYPNRYVSASQHRAVYRW